MKRGLKITLTILGVLVLIVAGVAFWATRPTTAAPYASIIDDDAAELNAIVAGGLAEENITDAIVDVDATRVYVLYDATAAKGNATLLQELQEIVLGAAAGAVVDEGIPEAIIVQVIDGKPVEMWTADITHFNDVIEEKTPIEDFLATVTKTKL